VTDRELMQQALNVLKIFVDGGNSAWARKIIEIKEALRDRLAQPEEPDWSAAGFGQAKREWQALTDEEVFAVENSVPDAVITDRDWCVHFARAIEVKLKEKNT
jgi:hypothetical protein